MPDLTLAQDADADAVLSSNPLALLIGMLLDQQFPMERAFASPALLTERLGGPLTAAGIAEYDTEALVAAFTGPPALHRYPRSMAERVQALCRTIVADWGGEVERLWTDAADGRTVLANLQSLPGFGKQKAQIFTALLGKQCDVRPEGWREAAGSYGDDGSRRSIADVVDPVTLGEVREFKQAQKKAAKAAKADAPS
ncbi:HhH-GPD-type base excision DNA repair protein [Actinomycetospora callitridis]|uniref:HhH-GPD-type base excision DNA repair protein n=1 Tax=Actinomycetospora callitridis TaxID=913944 RepID=UPI002365EE19|nr:HhH-GPD-type base excision DNA repair protein [Actinomycetospora callitridis]MDD7917164.1 Fe-S cluster assembly protein HesB [Actinomycetospora callitridis]